MDESVPEDNDTITQQEINYLAEFLNNFDKGPGSITSNDRRFNMERIGQYLDDKNLVIPVEIDVKQHWSNLLNQNQCLRDCNLIYPHHKHLSLVQQNKMLKNSINEVFKKPEQIIGDNFRIKQIVKCIDFNGKSIKPDSIFVTQTNLNDEDVGIFAIMESPLEIIIVEFHKNSIIKSLKLQFQRQNYFENKFSAYGDLTFRHIQFYSQNVLSILMDSNLNGRRSSCFVQFTISQVRNLAIESQKSGNEKHEINKINRMINMYDVLDPSCIRHIENLDAHFISVSGNRKVSSILSENLRRIRFYEMETEEEDEDLDASQNNSLDNSKDSTS